jgi:hypothetical protein
MRNLPAAVVADRGQRGIPGGVLVNAPSGPGRIDHLVDQFIPAFAKNDVGLA